MANKFLGLDSINVLKDYIDKQILQNEESTRLITVHAYRYATNGTIPTTPEGGRFDPEGAGVQYPEGWAALKTVLNNIGDNTAIEAALANGSIWMSVGVAEGNDPMTDTWSTPMKVSGQNGVSVRFAYSYNENATIDERTNNPSGTSEANPVEYVWTKFGEDDWSGPTVWARYVTDASDVFYRYCTTATSDRPNAPIDDVDPNWTNSAAASITQAKPFMWMSSKRVTSEQTSNLVPWGEPILFGHYGKDGRDGLDGNIPDYAVTLYAMSADVESVPEFICENGALLSDIRETNKDVWFDLPTSEDATETTIWWYVVLNINGGTRENPELKDTVKNFSEPRRYSAIDGNVQTSVFTKYLFYWSANQTIPEDLSEDAWVEVPEYKADEQDGSLWMKVGVAKLDTTTGEVVMVNTDKPWSDPVKITGPRGPIAYDYRSESLFGAGTENVAPTTWKKISEIKLSDATPYVWEKRYLSLYKMKYADTANADGTYDVVEDKFIKQIGDPDVFRLSGLNGVVGANGQDGKDGANGNRLNTIDYTTSDKNLGVSNFDEINYFISNSSSDTHYTLNGNKFGEFVSGYTGKFTNIGTGKMIITTVDAKIVGSNAAVNEIVLNPQESIDLISYLNNGTCEFILIGKAIETVDNPVENPGALDSAQLVDRKSVV